MLLTKQASCTGDRHIATGRQEAENGEPRGLAEPCPNSE